MNIPAGLGVFEGSRMGSGSKGMRPDAGITDFAQSQLGDIVFVDVTTEGETLVQNEIFGTIEAVKTVSDAFLPVGGEGARVQCIAQRRSHTAQQRSLRQRVGWSKINMTIPQSSYSLLSARAITPN